MWIFYSLRTHLYDLLLLAFAKVIHSIILTLNCLLLVGNHTQNTPFLLQHMFLINHLVIVRQMELFILHLKQVCLIKMACTTTDSNLYKFWCKSYIIAGSLSSNATIFFIEQVTTTGSSKCHFLNLSKRTLW